MKAVAANPNQLALPLAVPVASRHGMSPERARELFAWMRRHVDRCADAAAMRAPHFFIAPRKASP